MSATTARISSLVREAISAATGLDLESLLDSTPLVETNMDSLTLVSVVSQAENAFHVVFSTDELAEILRARDVGELVAAVARKIGGPGDSNSREL
ncbi:MAG TPA: acyl carrier protein [Gammaproteobacteria bacterium]|nr:acyl carrier protein [Gammaproteobacteria bacterium]